MRLIDADVLLGHYQCNDVTGVSEEDIKLATAIPAIPVDYIMDELVRIANMIDEPMCTEERKYILIISKNTLEAVISNWNYTTGWEWREKYERFL